jgi:hypothetical protein
MISSDSVFRDPSGNREVQPIVREPRHGGPTQRVGGAQPGAERL